MAQAMVSNCTKKLILKSEKYRVGDSIYHQYLRFNFNSLVEACKQQGKKKGTQKHLIECVELELIGSPPDLTVKVNIRICKCVVPVTHVMYFLFGDARFGPESITLKNCVSGTEETIDCVNYEMGTNYHKLWEFFKHTIISPYEVLDLYTALVSFVRLMDDMQQNFSAIISPGNVDLDNGTLVDFVGTIPASYPAKQLKQY